MGKNMSLPFLLVSTFHVFSSYDIFLLHLDICLLYIYSPLVLHRALLAGSALGHRLGPCFCHAPSSHLAPWSPPHPVVAPYALVAT
jgi:hypothetical protein